jgi:hypothetical protein
MTATTLIRPRLRSSFVRALGRASPWRGRLSRDIPVRKPARDMKTRVCWGRASPWRGRLSRDTPV